MHKIELAGVVSRSRSGIEFANDDDDIYDGEQRLKWPDLINILLQ